MKMILRPGHSNRAALPLVILIGMIGLGLCVLVSLLILLVKDSF